MKTSRSIATVVVALACVVLTSAQQSAPSRPTNLRIVPNPSSRSSAPPLPPTPVPSPTPVPPEPKPGTYPYYELLVTRSDRLYAFPLRSSAELDRYRKGAAWAPDGTAFYDSAVDALQQFIHPGVLLGPSGRPGTGNTPRQVFLPVVIPSGVSFLQTWDSRYTGGFAWLGDAYLRGFKAFRWDIPENQGVPPIWFAINTGWKEAFRSGSLGWYYSKVPTNPFFILTPSRVGDHERIMPQTEFHFKTDAWMRTWVYYDAPAQQLSVWIGTAAGITHQLDRAKYGFPAPGINRFRLEYDTSQNQVDVANPLSRIWNRNVVVLQGIDYANVQRLLVTTGL